MSIGVPIYVGAKPVGRVTGDTFYKIVQASKHFLRRPPAICFDVSSINDAQTAGAAEICVLDSESDTRYYARIGLLLERGFTINRGFGEQIALIMKWWRLTEEPDAQQPELL